MPKDVVIVVNVDAKPRPSEALDILIVSTTVLKPFKTYRSLPEVEVDYERTTSVYGKVKALFEQGKTTLASTLFRKVCIVGVGPLTGDDDEDKAQDLIDKIEAVRETQSDDWYILMTDKEGDPYNTALGMWAEATEPTEAELGAGIEDHRKLYFFQTTDKEAAITSARSIGIFTASTSEHAEAAYLGNVGPFYPTSVTWKFKRPQGITLPDLTDAERDALEEANINFMTEEYKRVYVKNGVCCNGEFIDVQMGADYIAKDMRTRTYDAFLTNPKIPYTDAGFAIVADVVFATLNQAVFLGIVAKDYETGRGVYSVTIPRRADATEEQAASRTIPPIAWEATLEGAVHSVKVTGSLVVTMPA